MIINIFKGENNNEKFLAVVILFSFLLLPFFNVYGVHMLTHDIQRLSPNAFWGIGFLFLTNILWTTLVITIVNRTKSLEVVLWLLQHIAPPLFFWHFFTLVMQTNTILFLSHFETSIFSLAFVIGTLISLRILSKNKVQFSYNKITIIKQHALQ